MYLGEKIKHIRLSEGLTQKEFSQLVDIPLISVKNYEQGRREVNFKNLQKITTHFQFKKYALWLISDDFDNDRGVQVAPTEVENSEID